MVIPVASPSAVANVDWDSIGKSIVAIGAFGTAAFGLVESIGKLMAFPLFSGIREHFIGLPYAGFGNVKRMMKPMAAALICAYGDDYLEIIAQQYRADRSAGTAPDLVIQGVKLGLPFLNAAQATAVIENVWSMGATNSAALAAALQAPDAQTALVNAGQPANGAAPAAAAAIVAADPQALAGRFATALDARVNAAFDLAEEKYETFAKSAAAVVAVGLALAFNRSIGTPYSWEAAAGIGLIAVPLAPVAKDMSTYLQNALTAFKSISAKS